MVAAREATWRRRNMARRIGMRNQSWIAVAEPEERAANTAVVSASSSEAKIISTQIGVKTMKMTLSTASILAMQHGAARDRRGDDEVVRVLAGDREPARGRPRAGRRPSRSPG